MEISTHAPRKGSDTGNDAPTTTGTYFNPRPPQGERQHSGAQLLACWLISTHAPRKGSDPSLVTLLLTSPDFNPRPPQGERQTDAPRKYFLSAFQPTPPARGATQLWSVFARRQWISTHAPRKGSDLSQNFTDTQPAHFNPRPPQGERHKVACLHTLRLQFQPTPPARGATVISCR